ncbi:hypothetical protein ACHAWU_007361 [Discostella pseudostelligera]|uniref:Uncharacterized protein n=1 Tax=Discostella pseudostelligera TaxID=259834 RepID=A0ABD3MDH3_9STRA
MMLFILTAAGGMVAMIASLFSMHLVHSLPFEHSIPSMPSRLKVRAEASSSSSSSSSSRFAFISPTPPLPSCRPPVLSSCMLLPHYCYDDHADLESITPFALPCTDRRRRRYYRTYTKLNASPSIDHHEHYNMNIIQTNVIERLELTKQFERWRFMQKLLEGEISSSDIEDVLLLVLHAYLQHGPTASSSNNKNENGGNASPVLTPDQRYAVQDVIDTMISISDGIGDSRILHMLVLPPADWDSSSIDGGGVSSKEDNMVEVDGNALSILNKIELVLPDPNEDEDSHKSAWDVIIDLHGRESVRVEEEALQRGNTVESTGSSISVKYRAQSLQWRTLCTVGRVLIHLDFLTKGVLKEGTFSVD